MRDYNRFTLLVLILIIAFGLAYIQYGTTQPLTESIEAMAFVSSVWYLLDLFTKQVE
jgi:hypothetical protein